MSNLGTTSRQLDALEVATQKLLDVETEQDACTVALESVQAIFDTDIGGVWLYDSEAHELQYTAASDEAKRQFDLDIVYRPGNSLSWEAFASGEIQVYSKNSGSESLYNSESAIQSEMVLPVGEYGVLNVGRLVSDPFGERDQQIGRLLSSNIEAALERIYREHELQVEKNRIEEFVSIISHDLRNPLEVSSNYLALVEQDYEDERFGKVAGGLERIEDLVDGLLAITKQGSVVDSRSTIDLATLAETAWGNVYTPDGDFAIDDTIEIFGDRERLLQVFENLFRNSIEHGTTGSNGESISLRVGSIQTIPTSTRAYSAEQVIGFYIEDDGDGIPVDQRDEVFDTGWSTGGTGLGLSIVERIVDAHGWTIAVTSSLGSGARFEITADAKSVAPFEFP